MEAKGKEGGEREARGKVGDAERAQQRFHVHVCVCDEIYMYTWCEWSDCDLCLHVCVCVCVKPIVSWDRIPSHTEKYKNTMF